MKKYKDFLFGLLFGVIYFLGISFFTETTSIFAPFTYHLIAAILTIFFYFIIFRSKISAKKTIAVLIGLFVPTIIWGILVFFSISQWTFGL